VATSHCEVVSQQTVEIVFVQVLMEASHWMKIKADRIENLMILFTM
jgi:hypothetical protein